MAIFVHVQLALEQFIVGQMAHKDEDAVGFQAVSYTHLTLPTSDLV